MKVNSKCLLEMPGCTKTTSPSNQDFYSTKNTSNSHFHKMHLGSAAKAEHLVLLDLQTLRRSMVARRHDGEIEHPPEFTAHSHQQLWRKPRRRVWRTQGVRKAVPLLPKPSAKMARARNSVILTRLQHGNHALSMLPIHIHRLLTVDHSSRPHPLACLIQVG